MDCTTFQNSEIDALYGELDEAASAAMAAHAATCHACNARFEGLRSTRGVVLSVAIEAVPNDFESRIMAAVDAGLAKRAVLPAAAAAGTAPGATPAKAEGGAKIYKFMARPSFAVAATFVLVLGAGALLMTQTARKNAPLAASESSPAASALTPVPMSPPAEQAADLAGNSPAVAAATATAAASGYAMNDPNANAFEAVAAAPVAATPPGAVALAKSGKAQAGPEDKAFTAAKALFNAGRYAEALPKFEALKANNPEAELYAARCIARTQGCAAAAPRFDTAAQTNSGTDVGSRAKIEGAKCYRSSGDMMAARKRLETARDEGFHAQEASRELDALDRTGGGAAAGAVAAPKAMSPAPMAPMPAARPPAAKPHTTATH